MAAALHSRDEIATFIGSGETRLIAAGYIDPSRANDLFILEDGEAAQLREWTRDHLRCFFPDCPQPALKAVARAGRRDGFSHLSGAQKHSPESINHIQGKAVIAEWLVGLFGPDAVEVEAAVDTQRSRVADVLLRLPSGVRVAFEVQYASLTVAEWRLRHESYQAQGVVDVWLWGHTRLRRSRGVNAEAPFRLDDVQEEARRAGLPVVFIKPEDRTLAVAESTWRGIAGFASRRDIDAAVLNLREVDVDAHGLRSGHIDSLRRGSGTLNEFLIKQQHQAIASVVWRARAKMILRQRREAHERKTIAAAQRSETPVARVAVLFPCRVCGEALGEPFRARGYHTLCGRERLGLGEARLF